VARASYIGLRGSNKHDRHLDCMTPITSSRLLGNRETSLLPCDERVMPELSANECIIRLAARMWPGHPRAIRERVHHLLSSKNLAGPSPRPLFRATHPPCWSSLVWQTSSVIGVNQYKDGSGGATCCARTRIAVSH
jgi:hypothetical protein